MRAGHSQGSITERYIHAAQVAFPGAAERAEGRIFAAVGAFRYQVRYQPRPSPSLRSSRKAALAGKSGTPRVRFELTTLRLTAGCSAN